MRRNKLLWRNRFALKRRKDKGHNQYSNSETNDKNVLLLKKKILLGARYLLMYLQKPFYY